MPPRKSTSGQLHPPSKRAKTDHSPSTTPMHPPPLKSSNAAGPANQNAQAGPSRSSNQASTILAPAIPPHDWAETLTPGYVPVEGPARELNADERERLVHELVGFHPRKMFDDITEEARRSVIEIGEMIEQYMDQLANGKGEAYSREVDVGMYSLETLLSSHVDRQFDKYTSWALRNAFDTQLEGNLDDGIEIALPWCKGLDFDRGAYVASLPNGEAGIQDLLEEKRTKVEQMRYLSQQLERAERVLDRRLDIARQRKEEVGFISQTLADANLYPLEATAGKIKTNVSSLYGALSSMDPVAPDSSAPAATMVPAGPDGQKAWEKGRQAYLAWAVGKALASASGLGSAVSDQEPVVQSGLGKEELEEVERSLSRAGKQADIKAAARAL